MSKKVEKKRSTRTADTPRARGKRGEVGKQNLKPNREGRPDKRHCFTDTIRAELLKRKKFRRPDGSIMEASELELIALKVIRELRTAPEMNHRLLGILLDRIEGKPKEAIDIDAKVELASGLNARDVLLERLDRILNQAGIRTKDSEEDDDD